MQALEGDLATYKKVVRKDLSKEADKLCKMDPPNAKEVQAKQVQY